MIRLAVAGGLLVALVAALWWAWGLRGDVADLRATNDALSRQITQARIAEGIARHLLTEETARREAVTEAVTEIYGGPDADLPDHLRELLADGL